MVRKERHAGAEYARDVHAVVAAQMQFAELHAVHLILGHQDAARNQGGVRRREIDLFVFLAEECHDGGLGIGARNNSQLVAQKDLRIGRGTRDDALVQHARTDEGAADELANVAYRLTADAGIGYRNVKENGCIPVGIGLFFPVLILFLEIDAKQPAQKNRRHDDAHHAERISAGIGHRDVFAFVAEHVERLLRGAQARSVRDGAVMNAEHLRQRNASLEKEVECERHSDAQHDRKQREQIELKAAALKGGEKRRPHLQSDEKDKENEPEVAHEVEHRAIDGNARVAEGERNKEHEGDAERYAEQLDSPERHTERDDRRVHKQNVTDGIGVREKLSQPIHINLNNFRAAASHGERLRASMRGQAPPVARRTGRFLPVCRSRRQQSMTPIKPCAGVHFMTDSAHFGTACATASEKMTDPHTGRPLLKKKRFGDPRRDTVVSEPVADGLSMLDQLKI